MCFDKKRNLPYSQAKWSLNWNNFYKKWTFRNYYFLLFSSISMSSSSISSSSLLLLSHSVSGSSRSSMIIKHIDKSIIEQNTYHSEGIVWLSLILYSVLMDILYKDRWKIVMYQLNWSIKNHQNSYRKQQHTKNQRGKNRKNSFFFFSLSQLWVSYYKIKQLLDFICVEKKIVIVRLSLWLSDFIGERIFPVFLWFWWNVCEDINKSNTGISIYVYIIRAYPCINMFTLFNDNNVFKSFDAKWSVRKSVECVIS